MKIMIFGKLTDIFQNTIYEVSEVVTVTELRKHLEIAFPDLKKYNYLVAVNKQIVNGENSIPKNAEIALLPPFSGG